MEKRWILHRKKYRFDSYTRDIMNIFLSLVGIYIYIINLCKLGAHSLVVERHTFTVKTWVQFPLGPYALLA
jgi:hypothetical protein